MFMHNSLKSGIPAADTARSTPTRWVPKCWSQSWKSDLARALSTPRPEVIGNRLGIHQGRDNGSAERATFNTHVKLMCKHVDNIRNGVETVMVDEQHKRSKAIRVNMIWKHGNQVDVVGDGRACEEEHRADAKPGA